jgi:hypothetical protein
MPNDLIEYWPFLVLAIWVYIVERRERKLSDKVEWLEGELTRLKNSRYSSEK